MELVRYKVKLSQLEIGCTENLKKWQQTDTWKCT